MVRRGGGVKRTRKMLFMEAKKAHSNPRSEEEVYIEVPKEAGVPVGMCGKLDHC